MAPPRAGNLRRGGLRAAGSFLRLRSLPPAKRHSRSVLIRSRCAPHHANLPVVLRVAGGPRAGVGGARGSLLRARPPGATARGARPLERSRGPRVGPALQGYPPRTRLHQPPRQAPREGRGLWGGVVGFGVGLLRGVCVGGRAWRGRARHAGARACLSCRAAGRGGCSGAWFWGVRRPWPLRRVALGGRTGRPRGGVWVGDVRRAALWRPFGGAMFGWG